MARNKTRKDLNDRNGNRTIYVIEYYDDDMGGWRPLWGGSTAQNIYKESVILKKKRVEDIIRLNPCFREKDFRIVVYVRAE